MSAFTIWISFSLLAIVTALTPSLTKTMFFFTPENGFSPLLFQTKDRIITQSMEVANLSADATPQYLSIDLDSRNVTQILSDVIDSCDNSTYLLNRIFYHASMSTLVYYCTKNNTLLILDEDKYTVESTIPVDVDFTFEETRLSPDGDSVVIIGMKSPFSGNSYPSQFIKIDLAKKEIINNFSFNKYLWGTEFVVGFAANNSKSYIITNNFSPYLQYTANNVSIYSLSVTGNSYDLSYLTSFKYVNALNTFYINQLYCAGDLLVTNDCSNILFINQTGEIAYTAQNLIFKQGAFGLYYVWEPYLVMQYGSTNIYALLEELTQFSVDGETLTSETFDMYRTMSVAVGNRENNDLLFLTEGNFFVFDPQNYNIIYSVPNEYSDEEERSLLITDSTYAIYQEYNFLKIFDLATDDLITSLMPFGVKLFFDRDTFAYYLEQTETDCEVYRISLVTGESQVIYQLYQPNVCSGQITVMNSSNSEIPALVIKLQDDSYLIISQDFGQVQYIPDKYVSSLLYTILVPDFDNMSIYIVGIHGYPQRVFVYQFDYDNDTKTFSQSKSYEIDDPLSSFQGFYSIGKGEVIASGAGTFTLIKLAERTTTVYNYPNKAYPTTTTFYDDKDNSYVIFSDSYWYTNAAEPYLFTSNDLMQLPKSTSLTVQGGAAGVCSYWMLDGLETSLGFARFYNICQDENSSMIYY